MDSRLARAQIIASVLSLKASEAHSDIRPHAHSGDEIDYHNDEIDQAARDLVAALDQEKS